MRLEVGEGHITDDVVVLLGGVLLAYLKEVKEVALLGSLITEVDAENMVGGIVRKDRVVLLLVLVAVVIGTCCDVAKDS